MLDTNPELHHCLSLPKKKGCRSPNDLSKADELSCCIFALRMISDKTLQLAKKLWDYHHMDHALEKVDCILTLGSHDLRVAERAAQLYLEGWAPIMIFSGGLGNLTKEIWTQTEADQFAAIAIGMGVPEASILIENRSTNTG